FTKHGGATCAEDAYRISLLGLLRVRRARPRGRRATEQCDEGAALHSTTSSASASSVFGTLSPIAFAVFRLSTNRKRVGCSTGRSAGLPPLKIRSPRAAERSKISRRSGPYDIKPPALRPGAVAATAP